MKFYKKTLITAMIFQSFLCIGMDREQPLVQKKYVLKTEDTIIFPTPIPAELEKYFQPKAKLLMPKEAERKIRTACIAIKATQAIAIESAQNSTGQIAKIDLENDLLKKEAAVKALTEKKNTLQKLFDEREKILITQQKEIERRKKEIAESKKNISPVLPAPQKIKKNNTPPTTLEHRNALKSLMSQCKAREKHQIKTKLVDLCDDIWCRRCENNKSEGPYFNSNLHIICGQINRNWSYIFYPCKSQVATAKHSYAEIVGNIEKFLNPNFICDEKCNYYVSKCKKIESYSSTESSDMEMCSESD